MRVWGRTSGQDRGCPGWSLCEEQLSRPVFTCFFPSSHPSLGAHIHPAIKASALNSLVAEETIKVPQEQAAEMLFIAALTLAADVC